MPDPMYTSASYNIRTYLAYRKWDGKRTLVSCGEQRPCEELDRYAILGSICSSNPTHYPMLVYRCNIRIGSLYCRFSEQCISCAQLRPPLTLAATGRPRQRHRLREELQGVILVGHVNVPQRSATGRSLQSVAYKTLQIVSAVVCS